MLDHLLRISTTIRHYCPSMPSSLLHRRSRRDFGRKGTAEGLTLQTQAPAVCHNGTKLGFPKSCCQKPWRALHCTILVLAPRPAAKPHHRLSPKGGRRAQSDIQQFLHLTVCYVARDEPDVLSRVAEPSTTARQLRRPTQ